MKKTLLLGIVILLLVVLTTGVSAQEVTASGQCGDNLTWTLYDDGELVIEGTGDMWEFEYSPGNTTVPWSSHASSILKITVDDGVTSIGANAFIYCTRVTNVSLGSDITRIGRCAFEHCYRLERVSIPASVVDIGRIAFHKCDRLQSIDVAADNAVYTSVDGILFNKDKTTLIKYPAGRPNASYTTISTVNKLEEMSFFGCTYLSEIIITDNVTIIGDNAFVGSDLIERIDIPASIVSIGKRAFAQCRGLTHICVDADNLYFSSDENGVLYNKDKTTLIQYPIAKADTSYVISETVTSIGKWAFESDDDLEEIEIPAGVTSIGQSAFLGCHALKKATVYSKTATFEASVFSSASADFTLYGYRESTAEAYAIENNHPFVPMAALIWSGPCGDELFFELYDDGTLIITGTGEMWDFYWTTVLPFSVRVSTVSTRTAEAAPWSEYAEQVKQVIIQEGVTSIGEGAFYGCTAIEGGIVLPTSVTTISAGAFAGCTRMNIVEIPANVTSIGDAAFAGCEALETAKIFAKDVTFGVGVFQDTSFDFTIRDYAGSTAQEYASQNNHSFVPLAGGVLGQITSNDPTKSITVQLRQGETVVYTHTIEAEEGSGEVTQSFFFPTVDVGTYDLVILKAGHLPYTIQGLPVGEETVDLTAHINAAVAAPTLRTGDVSGDGIVDLKDLILLTADGTFNRPSAEAVNKSCDMNGDGSIDLKDLIILTSENNFNRGATEVPFTELSA